MSAHIHHQISARVAALRALEEQEDQHRRALEELERRRLVLEAELGAYQDAAEHLPQVRRKRHSSKEGAPLQRKLSRTWSYVLKGLGKAYPDTMRIHDVVRYAATGSHRVSNYNVRSQMAQYVEKGLVERVNPGEYRLTSLGAEELNITLKGKAPGEEPGALHSEGEAGLPAGPSKPAPTGSTPVSSTADPPWGGLDDEIPF